jgi:hypothetical protein
MERDRIPQRVFFIARPPLLFTGSIVQREGQNGNNEISDDYRLTTVPFVFKGFETLSGSAPFPVSGKEKTRNALFFNVPGQ